MEEKKVENLAYKIKKYTYEEFLEIDDGNRYELLDGELYLMSSPSRLHQKVVVELARQIGNYLEGKKCEVYVAPLNVKFFEKKDIYPTVVQPDVMIICDKNKLADKAIIGAPDLVIEVLSQYNASHDTFYKYNLYQHYGVKEYWIIDMQRQVITPYILNKDGVYTLPKMYKLTEDIKINILKNCTISLKKLFEENAELLKEEDEEYEVK